MLDKWGKKAHCLFSELSWILLESWAPLFQARNNLATLSTVKLGTGRALEAWVELLSVCELSFRCALSLIRKESGALLETWARKYLKSMCPVVGEHHLVVEEQMCPFLSIWDPIRVSGLLS